MVGANSTSLFVFTKDAVLQSIKILENQPIHEHFAGYLAILRAQEGKRGEATRLVDITEFHDRYLRVLDAPDKSPYLRPFKSRGQGRELFNANVAGSYAPSSLRAKGALKEVIEVRGEGRNATYHLKPDHAAVVAEQLLKRRKIPITALAAFIYRDYGFYLDSPAVSDVVMLFRQEFGLVRTVAHQEIFDVLFFDDSSEYDANALRHWDI